MAPIIDPHLRVDTHAPVTHRSASATILGSARTPASTESAAQRAADEATLLDLKATLSRATRANDRKAVLQALNECHLLANVPLDPVQPLSNSHMQWRELEGEVKHGTTVLLNGLEFRAGGSLQTEFLLVLKELCHKLSRNSNLSADMLYQSLLVRLAPSTSSADPQFSLNAMLGSADLLLQPTLEAQTAKILQDDAVAEISLYESGHEIHAQVTTQHHAFGLYRKSDVRGKPWIGVVGQVYERVNLSTGMSVRTLKAQFL